MIHRESGTQEKWVTGTVIQETVGHLDSGTQKQSDAGTVEQLFCLTSEQ